MGNYRDAWLELNNTPADAVEATISKMTQFFENQ